MTSDGELEEGRNGSDLQGVEPELETLMESENNDLDFLMGSVDAELSSPQEHEPSNQAEISKDESSRGESNHGENSLSEASPGDASQEEPNEANNSAAESNNDGTPREPTSNGEISNEEAPTKESETREQANKESANGDPNNIAQPNEDFNQGDLDPSGNFLPLDFAPLGGPEQSKEDSERERMKLLISHFDEQQMSRYAAFRRANIRRAAVRKYASQLLNQPISNSVAVVLAGMSKVLIGDIIELGRDLQEKEQKAERKHLGLPEPQLGSEPEPLLPQFIREAWRIYKEETGTVPGTKIKPGSGSRFF